MLGRHLGRQCGAAVRCCTRQQARCMASTQEKAGKAASDEVARLTKETELKDSEPSTTAAAASVITEPGGPAFPGDLRSSSGLGLGDGLRTHTAKWLQTDGFYGGNYKSPYEYMRDAPPIKVHGAVVASCGEGDPALGCPVEYIDLKGTSIDKPAVCKYTGNKYYSDDWMHAH